MILSFYSYKGGVGRTQLLANLASYLCFYQHKRILVMDWDLEAPGLHRYFKAFNKESIQKGILDLFIAFQEIKQEKQRKNESTIYVSEYPILDESYRLDITPPSPKAPSGYIHYVAPININDNEWDKKVTGFNWNDFWDNSGKSFVAQLKQSLKQMPYDYIFIDSRTGISDYAGISNIYLPEANIIVMAPNEQNIDGCKDIATKILNNPFVKAGRRSGIILPILSRIEKDTTADPQFWQNEFIKNFSPLFLFNDSLRSVSERFQEDFYNLYLDDTQLYYDRGSANGEKLFFPRQEISNDSIDKKYENIAKLLYLQDKVLLKLFLDFYEADENLPIDTLYELRDSYAEKNELSFQIEVELTILKIYKRIGYKKNIIDAQINTTQNLINQLKQKLDVDKYLENMPTVRNLNRSGNETTKDRNVVEVLIQSAKNLAANSSYGKAIKELEDAQRVHNVKDTEIAELLKNYQRLFKEKYEPQTQTDIDVSKLVKYQGFKVGDLVLVDWKEDVYSYPCYIDEIDEKKELPYKLHFCDKTKTNDWYSPYDVYKWDLSVGEKIKCQRGESKHFLYWAVIQKIKENSLVVKYEDNQTKEEISFDRFVVTR